MEYKDYYRTLGVDKSASPEEVRAAYRKLARRYHPDVNPNNKAAEERFKDINEAYEVLRDAEKRRKYDQLGADWQRYQQMGGAADGFDWSQWFSSGGGAGRQTRTEYVDLNDLFGEGSFSDFFQYIFGGGAPRGGFAGSAQRSNLALNGRDIEQPVEISLEEAYAGTTRVFQLGSRRIEVKIPAGVQTGSRVRVSGEGEAGRNNGQPGDLYLIITVREHPEYRREEDDLRKTLPVDLYTLVLGGEVLVDTFKGRISLKIPPETKAGQSFRLRGRGMPKLRHPDGYGDLYVEVEPIIPQNLSESERELYRRLSDMREVS
jgi:curved DNA-binding protein